MSKRLQVSNKYYEYNLEIKTCRQLEHIQLNEHLKTHN